MTKAGFEALKRELENLKRVERPQNINAIEEARAHGDLSENAEFAEGVCAFAQLQLPVETSTEDSL